MAKLDDQRLFALTPAWEESRRGPNGNTQHLLVWGELDADTPVQDGRLMDQMIPDSRLEVLPGAGHYCYIDDFPGFSRVVSAFLGSSE